MSILSMIYDFINDTVLLIPEGHALEAHAQMISSMLIIFTFFVFGVILIIIVKIILWSFNIVASRFYL